MDGGKSSGQAGDQSFFIQQVDQLRITDFPAGTYRARQWLRNRISKGIKPFRGFSSNILDFYRAQVDLPDDHPIDEIFYEAFLAQIEVIATGLGIASLGLESRSSIKAMTNSERRRFANAVMETSPLVDRKE